MTDFKEKLLCIFFPARCCVCDEVILPGRDICEKCSRLVLSYPSEKASCKICGIEYGKCTCSKRLLYSTVTTPFLYAGDVKRALHRMKFRNRLDLIKPYAKRIATALRQKGITDGIDIITYIPMRKKSQFARGYNQAELLADEIGKITGIPVKQLLYKVHSTPEQHKLGLSRRRGNIIGAFEPVKECIKDIEGKNILIIDDIVTTGSTLNEAAKTLLIFGAERTDVAAAAQGQYKKEKKL